MRASLHRDTRYADIRRRAAACGRPGSQRPVGAAATAKASAPMDLTGYWVALVTEDWRFRMVTPRKGDYQCRAHDGTGAERSRMRGIRRPTKLRAINAKPTEPLRSCGYPRGFTSRGRTTIRCGWRAMPACRRGSSISIHLPSPAGERTWQGYSTAQWQSRRR